MDVAKYNLTETSDPNATAESGQNPINGSWTYAGLSDAVAGGSTVSCTFAGRNTCEWQTECYDTKQYYLEYEASFNGYATTGGDSGGAYVDSDSKLVAIHSGKADYDSDSAYEKTFGGVGRKALNRINVVLYNPDLIQ
jgi:hypothetical protein